jgi:hypothetical protein
MGRADAMFGLRHGALVTLAAVLAVAGATAFAVAQDDGDLAGELTDAIVGAWTGTAAQPEQDPFEVNLTFVSPKGGISRYPGETPCGGVLVGDRKGDGYEYQESITYNGTDERPQDGCISGTMTLTLEGDTMKYSWSGTSNGQEYTSSGELKRKGKRR